MLLETTAGLPLPLRAPPGSGRGVGSRPSQACDEIQAPGGNAASSPRQASAPFPRGPSVPGLEPHRWSFRGADDGDGERRSLP